MPFIDSKFYKGQIAEMLGGVDLSWLVGLLSTAVLYYVLAKRAQIKISKALQLERVK
ncbi:cytosine/purine/uracil/thiamine/allantoin permease domain protein [Acinetobacter baumannii 44327_6]|nr:cytosine/purine/uracil/thiamine/allantoin permease domain protein [Acinetobacter baumannii 44327_6]